MIAFGFFYGKLHRHQMELISEIMNFFFELRDADKSGHLFSVIFFREDSLSCFKTDSNLWVWHQYVTSYLKALSSRRYISIAESSSRVER